MLRPREFACSLLLKAAWTEAEHFGGLVPMRMVAQCIGNRVRAGWGDWHQVLDSLGQYSALSVIPRVKLPSPNDPRFLALLPLIDQVYDNSGEDLSNKGLFWADLRHLNGDNSNDWFKEHVQDSGEYKKVAQNSLLILWG
jgi:hypothetical protein